MASLLGAWSWSRSWVFGTPGWDEGKLPEQNLFKLKNQEIRSPVTFCCSRDHVGPAPTLIYTCLGCCSSLWIQVCVNIAHMRVRSCRAADATVMPCLLYAPTQRNHGLPLATERWCVCDAWCSVRLPLGCRIRFLREGGGGCVSKGQFPLSAS